MILLSPFQSWARLMSQGRTSGRPRNAMNMNIAAVGEANGCVIVTDDSHDFHGISVFNPLADDREV